MAASTVGSSAMRSALASRCSAGTSIVPSPSHPYRAGSVTSRTRLAEKATVATTAPIASAAVTTGVRARWMRRPTRCSTAIRRPTATGTGRLARMTGSVTTDGVVGGASSGSGAVSRAPRRAVTADQHHGQGQPGAAAERQQREVELEAGFGLEGPGRADRAER